MSELLGFQGSWLRIVDGIRARLASREVIQGVFVAFPERRLMDFWATAGMDFVIIDMEHAMIGLQEADSLVEAAVHAGLAPLVRAAGEDKQVLLRCLDAGAAGIVVPDVQSVEEVEEWARVVSYPPTGTRGLAQVRFNNWNSAGTSDDPRLRPILVPMIESETAIERASYLFALEYVDWYHIGLVDLRMRLRDDANAPTTQELLSSLASLADKAGMPIGANQPVGRSHSELVKGVGAVAVTDRALILNGALLFTEGFDA